MSIFYLKDGDTLGTAIKQAKKDDTIVLQDKTYREKVIVDVPSLTVIGGGSNCRVVWDDYAKKLDEQGREYVTFRTQTVIVTAKNVTFKNFTIENDRGNCAELGQEVALSVYADGFYAENMTLKSLQDTLFCGPLPDDLVTRYLDFLPDKHRYFEGQAKQMFFGCKIYGSVDYVFGCATAYFMQCEFINVDDGKTQGFVAAPAHSLKQETGFVFINCDFNKADGVAAEVYLARPWRDYGKCTFINCRLDGVSEKLFDKWNDTERDRTARFEVYGIPLTKNAVNWLKELEPAKIKKYFSSADAMLNAMKKRTE